MANVEQQQIMNDKLEEISDILDRKLDRKNDFGEYNGDILHNMEWHLGRIADALEKIANK